MSTAVAERAEDPYLSVVVTARNDDHGGDPLYRMQAFVDSFLHQCDTQRLPAELIVVEWNPPEDRPRLAEVLSWPRTAGWCAVRIIEVPHEVHLRLQHAESLPLFQMIAKNVGIRRARGLFVLATNIDVLFDDALIRRLAAQRLQPARLYRVDRYDVPGTIDAPPDKWLGWCRRSVMRIHTAHGSVDVRTGDFYPIGRHSRVAQAIRAAFKRRPGLVLAVRRAQAGIDELFDPLVGGPALVEAARRARLATGTVSAPTKRLLLGVYKILLVVRDVGFYVRIGLVFVRDLLWLLRTFSYWLWCGLQEPRLAPRRAARRFRRLRGGLVARARSLRTPRGPKDSRGPSRRALRAAELGRMEGMLAAWRVRRSMPPLHTNACGDFTLMARTDWERTRAYPELQRFSMHIDGLFLFQAHYAGIRERMLPYPVFHLEHGSGFRPDTSSVRELEDRLERDKIRQITDTEFLEWAVEMRAMGRPLGFNGDDWGFRDVPLSEYDPMHAIAVTA